MTHPQHANVCVHYVFLCSVSRFRDFRTNSRDSIRVNRKPLPHLFAHVTEEVAPKKQIRAYGNQVIGTSPGQKEVGMGGGVREV